MNTETSQTNGIAMEAERDKMREERDIAVENHSRAIQRSESAEREYEKLKDNLPSDSVAIPRHDYESLCNLLYGAWEDTGLLHEQEVLANEIQRNESEYGNDRKAQVDERIDWMNDFYQRVVIPNNTH